MTGRRSTYQLTIVALLLCTTILGSKATDYRTDRLALIARLTGVVADSTATTFRGKPLAICRAGGRVCHIGYRLFSDAQRQLLGTEVCNFVERYLLELDIPTDAHLSTAERKRKDLVTIEGTANPMLLAADSTVSAEVEQQDGRRYTVSFCQQGSSLWSISFPVEYNLIIGTDMDERERRLPAEIRLAPDSTTTRMPDAGTLRKSWHENYFTQDGGTYLLDQMRGDRYFELDSLGHLQPIFGRHLPAESLANLFTSLLVEGQFTLDMQVSVYGMKKERIQVPLRQWTTFCLDEGCQPYFGIISLNDDEAEGELIMHNATLGYNHVMKVSCPLTIIDKRQGTINARLLPYVTTSRVNNIFDEYKTQKP